MAATTTAAPSTSVLTTPSTTTPSNTYSSVIVTSFPFNPLTTRFVAPSYCNAIYSGAVYMVDAQNDCLPSSHPKEETAYFSPGYVCPEGYMTAKVDNKGVKSITTVTCCPYRGDIILSAVDPATLSSQWIDLFCTWIAPEPTRIDIVHNAETRTWTEQDYVMSPGGVNAYGVRMVYQSTDIATINASHTGSVGGSVATSNVTVSTGTAEPGLSRGASIAVAAIVPAVVLGLIAGALFWWWKKRQAEKYSRVTGNGTPGGSPSKPAAPGMSPANSMMHPGQVHEAPSMPQNAYLDPHAYQHQHQHQQHPPMQTMQSMHSLPSTYQSSTMAPSSIQQHSPNVAYAQQYGAYTSYAGYKPPTVAEEAPPSVVTGQTLTPTSELPAAVPRELSDEHRSRTASGMHIDHQKMMGMGPFK